MKLDPVRIRKVTRNLRKVVKKSSGLLTPNEVHNFRTNLRRYESILDTLRPDPDSKEKRLLRDIGRLQKRAGEIRDMDVLTATVATLKIVGDDDCTVQLLQFLGVRRYKYARRLERAIDARGKKFRRRLKSVSGQLIKNLSKENRDSKNDNRSTETQTTSTAIQLTKDLGTPKTLNHQNLHPYRRKVKELRNVLKLSAAVEDETFTNRLGEVKDAIGDWHDWEELMNIASKVLDHDGDSKLMHKLKEVTQNKYDHALSVARKMRKQLHRRKKQKPGLITMAAVA